MAYLAQKTRAASLLIGGQDYTSSLVRWEVSDAGAFKKGLITTSGLLTLGQRPGFDDISDYDRNLFKRGTVVTLDVISPGGGLARRHPRGYLYIISSVYNVEIEQLEVEIGCKLSLAYLTDDASSILPLVPIPLDPVQQTVENCSASFAAAGMYLYQNNSGSLISGKFFGLDSSEGFEFGRWTSALGVTTLSVQPLASGGAIPDEIKLSYQVPKGLLAGDNKGKQETVTETSNYFLNYPATVWKRNPNPTPTGEIQLPDKVVPNPPVPQPPSGCGNTPQPPQNGGTSIEPGGTESFYLCSDVWTTDRTNVYLPATRVTTSTTTYGGPGAQVSFVEQTVAGPDVESNPSYFADWFSYCVNTYGSACNPQGSCPYYGMNTVTLSKQLTYYKYGQTGELLETIQDNYQTLLSAYTTNDYRAGIQNGVPTGFSQGKSGADGLYRQARIITKYYKDNNNNNVQFTTTFTSMTSRGVGVYAGVSLDALDGIKTTVKRESTTTGTLSVRPDTANSPSTTTEEEYTTVIINTNGYQLSPSEAGPYIEEDSIPVPLLSETRSDIDGWVDDYTEYLTRFTRGDLYGLQIAEALRTEIITNWKPGQSFRYADTANDTVSAMRADACTWGVTQEEAIVVMNGIWLGFSSGSLIVPENLSGNSRPVVGGSPIPPSGPGVPPYISNDIVGQDVAYEVDVNLYLDASMFTYFADGISNPNPSDLTGLVEQAIVPYVTGFVVETGGLLEIGGTGTIPVEYGGSFVTATANVVNADVFDADAFVTATESPGTLPATVLPNGTVQVLMHYDGNLDDDSGKSRVFTAENGATTSTTQTKFGSHSLELATKAASISTPADVDAGFDFKDKDFTIELFFYPLVDTGFETLIAASGQGDWFDELAWQVRLEKGTDYTFVKFEYMIDDDYNIYLAKAQMPTALSSNQWHHLVVQRDWGEGTIAMWLDGEQILSLNHSIAQQTIRDVSDKTNPILRIGAKADTGTNSFPGFKGFIDDVRIVKRGLRYQMNATTITVPTSPLTTAAP